ncbi:MAG: hypothetical protein KGJ89_01585 [Patescibacteria group bacterium]|nr:hypothetical protein [Patescibacteria group bacterium]MDE2015201.1 hypothetical protein [Patescibacteria group bacterium]MDE2226628.1 hypothetical protein [Patescibacteria group bacterium]
MLNSLFKQILLRSGLVKEAFAQTLINPLGTGATFTSVVDSVINFLITIGIPIAAVMVLVGGFQMMVSAGNPEKISSGKKTIVYAAIGIAVILAGKSIIVLIKNVLGAS